MDERSQTQAAQFEYVDLSKDEYWIAHVQPIFDLFRGRLQERRLLVLSDLEGWLMRLVRAASGDLGKAAQVLPVEGTFLKGCAMVSRPLAGGLPFQASKPDISRQHPASSVLKWFQLADSDLLHHEQIDGIVQGDVEKAWLEQVVNDFLGLSSDGPPRLPGLALVSHQGTDALVIDSSLAGRRFALGILVLSPEAATVVKQVMSSNRVHWWLVALGFVLKIEESLLKRDALAPVMAEGRRLSAGRIPGHAPSATPIQGPQLAMAQASRVAEQYAEAFSKAFDRLTLCGFFLHDPEREYCWALSATHTMPYAYQFLGNSRSALPGLTAKYAGVSLHESEISLVCFTTREEWIAAYRTHMLEPPEGQVWSAQFVAPSWRHFLSTPPCIFIVMPLPISLWKDHSNLVIRLNLGATSRHWYSLEQSVLIGADERERMKAFARLAYREVISELETHIAKWRDNVRAQVLRAVSPASGLPDYAALCHSLARLLGADSIHLFIIAKVSNHHEVFRAASGYCDPRRNAGTSDPRGLEAPTLPELRRKEVWQLQEGDLVREDMHYLALSGSASASNDGAVADSSARPSPHPGSESHRSHFNTALIPIRLEGKPIGVLRVDDAQSLCSGLVPPGNNVQADLQVHHPRAFPNHLNEVLSMCAEIIALALSHRMPVSPDLQRLRNSLKAKANKRLQPLTAASLKAEVDAFQDKFGSEKALASAMDEPLATLRAWRRRLNACTASGAPTD